jgi:hypothetical protein
VRPSICSRRMSACPACRPVSSIMWVRAHRIVADGPRPGEAAAGWLRSVQASTRSTAARESARTLSTVRRVAARQLHGRPPVRQGPQRLGTADRPPVASLTKGCAATARHEPR